MNRSNAAGSSPAPDADVALRAFLPADHAAALALWERTPGVGLSAADRYEAIAMFLARSPGLSFTAWQGNDLAGTILCGHDGRRGLIHHLVVAPAMRRRGLGRALVAASLDGLARAGIDKCHLLVFTGNREGQDFWAGIGAAKRDELSLYSLPTGARW
ncbi:GNAT family N-acetyltransferase [Bordetella genomosp. 10]|nr:GNAT family N-acetyltransferase [Bordetella genomosp. 10]